MPVPETILDWPLMLPAFALAVARISGLFMTAPILSSPAIPVRVKVYAASAMSLVVIPALPAGAVERITWLGLAMGVLAEVAVGACLGFAASLIFAGLQIGVQAVSQQMGVAIANVFNPAFNAASDVLGQVYYWTAAMGFLVAGGHRLLVRGLLETFSTLPPLAFSWPEGLSVLVVGLFTAAMNIAVRVAWPGALALLLAELAMGFVHRTVPQMNILMIGLPLRAMLGALVAMLTMGLAGRIVLLGVDGAMQAVFRLMGG